MVCQWWLAVLVLRQTTALKHDIITILNHIDEVLMSEGICWGSAGTILYYWASILGTQYSIIDLPYSAHNTLLLSFHTQNTILYCWASILRTQYSIVELPYSEHNTLLLSFHTQHTILNKRNIYFHFSRTQPLSLWGRIKKFSDGIA